MTLPDYIQLFLPTAIALYKITILTLIICTCIYSKYNKQLRHLCGLSPFQWIALSNILSLPELAHREILTYSSNDGMQ